VDRFEGALDEAVAFVDGDGVGLVGFEPGSRGVAYEDEVEELGLGMSGQGEARAGVELFDFCARQARTAKVDTRRRRTTRGEPAREP
jgi:hypothetical protein